MSEAYGEHEYYFMMSYCRCFVLNYVVQSFNPSIHSYNYPSNFEPITTETDQLMVCLVLDYMLKFLIIGSAGSGKSCLLKQFIDKKCKLLPIYINDRSFKLPSVRCA